jgi:hypothetical protein
MNNTAKTSSILDTAVNIEPIGVMFNIKGSDISDFVANYLESKGVTGLTDVRAVVTREGQTRPEVVLYVFVDQSSPFVVSKMDKIPPILKNKVDKIDIGLSPEFKKILTPLTGPEINSGKTEGRECFVKLDIFRALGLMLAADFRHHRIIVTDGKQISNGRDCIISVIKQESFNQYVDPSDKRGRQIENLERRH